MNNKTMAKIIIIAVMSIALVIASIAAFSALSLMNEKSFESLNTLVGAGTTSSIEASFWMHLGISLGLLMVIIALVLKLVDKGEFAPFMFIGAGVVAMILIFVSFGANSANLDALRNTMEASKVAIGTPLEITHKAATASYYKSIIIPVLNLITFAFVPLSIGLKGLLSK